VLATFYDSPQEFKRMPEDPLFLLKIRSFNSIFVFTCMGASLTKNYRIDEQLARARTVCVQGIICHLVGTLLPDNQEHQALPSCTFSIEMWKHK